MNFIQYCEVVLLSPFVSIFWWKKCSLFSGRLFLLMNHLIGWNMSIMSALLYFSRSVLLVPIISTEVTQSRSWTSTQQADRSFCQEAQFTQIAMWHFCIWMTENVAPGVWMRIWRSINRWYFKSISEHCLCFVTTKKMKTPSASNCLL